MKKTVNKIAKIIAISVFFIALLFNVKVSLEDPFLYTNNIVLAQNSSGECTSPTGDCPGGACSYQSYFAGEPKSCCTACCTSLLRARCDSGGCQCI